MVSRKSELYRAHPDWVLGFSGTSLIEARHQLVLDLGREEVVDYLFESISTLLTETPIGYLKWDMNRDIHQMENAVGQRAVHQQTTAVYALMARIRKQFPHVEMESCASGGGRLDMGVLQHATRFWPSDTNDALDRIRVQTGFLSMLPPELMGSHVGPSPCHLTGRQHSMAFRAGIALWGHMGVEADIRALDERERTVLEAAINLHKQHRLLLHRGRYVEHEASAQQVAWSVVSADQTEAISGLALMETPNTAFPKRMRFLGIDAAKQYRVNLVWPQELSGAQAQYRDSLQTNTFGGDWLQQAGLEPPIMRPESILIYHLTAT
jgi:alpha-galactosidase